MRRSSGGGSAVSRCGALHGHAPHARKRFARQPRQIQEGNGFASYQNAVLVLVRQRPPVLQYGFRQACYAGAAACVSTGQAAAAATQARTWRLVGAKACRERSLGRPLSPPALRCGGVMLPAAKERQQLHGRGKGEWKMRCESSLVTRVSHSNAATPAVAGGIIGVLYDTSNARSALTTAARAPRQASAAATRHARLHTRGRVARELTTTNATAAAYPRMSTHPA